MDYIANVENSEIDVSGIRTVLVQGDSSYPVIRFVLDPSLTGLSWRVRGTYTDSNIPVLSPEIVPVESATEITLDWSVSSDFTTYYGNMQLVVVGANDSGTVITKALGEVTIQRDYSIGTMAEITLNLFEQLFAQTESAISTHNSDESAHSTQIAAAISTHNANTSAHADKEKTSNKVTSISSASTDVQYPSAKATYGAISPLMVNHSWLYDGRDLSTIFTAAQFIAALRADDWSNIRVGDYWPITLTGTFRDYGSYTCPIGTNYYSDAGLTTLVGTTGQVYEAAYVNATYCSISISGTTYYVSTAACLDYYARTLSNAVFKMEVAGISPYINYGDTAFASPHIVLISRDCIPHSFKMRKSDADWTDGTSTNPWLGSALYKTLNEATYGLLPLVAATGIGAYIYAGPSGGGMRWLGETKAAGVASPTSSLSRNRGKLFIPFEQEIFSQSYASDTYYSKGVLTQLPIFVGSTRHVVKGLGNGGARSYWWLASSVLSSSTNFASISVVGNPNINSAGTQMPTPLCFIIA